MHYHDIPNTFAHLRLTSNIRQLCIALPKHNCFDPAIQFAFTFTKPKQCKAAFVFLMILDRLQHRSIPAEDGREAHQSPFLSNIL